VPQLVEPAGHLVLYTPCQGRGAFRIASELLASVGGVRMFDRRELPAALKVRGVTDVRQRVGGMFQLVDAHNLLLSSACQLAQPRV
jgi:hypothetical protein